MTTSGPGEAWTKRREAMGKAIDDVAADLRISPKFIRAIEGGDYAGFPARVFSSGFIRAYARYLSEDPEPVLTHYYRQLEASADAAPKPAVRPEWLEREKQRGSRRNAYFTAAGVVLVLGAVLGWYSMRSVPAPPPPPERSPAPAATPPENVGAAPAAPDNAAPENAVPAEARAGAPAAPAPAPAPREGSGPWHLQIEAVDQSWLLYRRDDANPVDVILNPGDRIAIRAEKKLEVRFGNAGGVKATLNGTPMPPFGPRGKVRVFRLGE